MVVYGTVCGALRVQKRKLTCNMLLGSVGACGVYIVFESQLSNIEALASPSSPNRQLTL
jgi:hypothetical protein